MKKRQVITQFLNDICAAFPEVRPLMNRHEQSMPTAKMEAFANETTRAFAVGDLERGTAYLEFMSRRLDPGRKLEFEYIDVYYVEALFWPHGSPAAAVGWPCVPDNLKALFLRFHGRPPVD